MGVVWVGWWVTVAWRDIYPETDRSRRASVSRVQKKGNVVDDCDLVTFQPSSSGFPFTLQVKR